MASPAINPTNEDNAEEKAGVQPNGDVILTQEAFKAAERNPSEWNITAGEEEDTIVARHDRGRVFEGTIIEFNLLLRGN